MKIIWSLALLVCAGTSVWAQQPPWNPIQNTNALPTNAIICRLDVLTADVSASHIDRHRLTPVSVTGSFALSWCHTNEPNAIASGTLNYTLLVDGPLSPTATFHIFGPAGRSHAPTDLFRLERVGSIDLSDPEIRDFLAGEWYLVILNSGTPGRSIFGRITP